jgi:rubrerythrin
VELIGSQTEKNLLTAFAGESQARNRYTYFAKAAKKEGFVQISQIFERTADQEKEHAKRLFKFLQGGEVEVVASFPAGVIGNTLQNLEASAAGENYEYTPPLPPLQLPKNNTKNSTSTLWTISLPAGSSSVMIRLSGTVPTAATCTKEPSPR